MEPISAIPIPRRRTIGQRICCFFRGRHVAVAPERGIDITPLPSGASSSSSQSKSRHFSKIAFNAPSITTDAAHLHDLIHETQIRELETHPTKWFLTSPGTKFLAVEITKELSLYTLTDRSFEWIEHELPHLLKMEDLLGNIAEPSEEQLSALTNCRAQLERYRAHMASRVRNAYTQSRASSIVSVDESLEKELPKLKIAVVDDTIGMRKLFAKHLAPYAEGEVLTAVDGGASVMTLLESHGEEIDVLFLDNNMPEHNGTEVIQIIKANPKWKNISVIFLTSDSYFHDTYAAMGFDAYLIKPVNPKQLRDALKTVYTDHQYDIDRRFILKESLPGVQS